MSLERTESLFSLDQEIYSLREVARHPDFFTHPLPFRSLIQPVRPEYPDGWKTLLGEEFDRIRLFNQKWRPSLIKWNTLLTATYFDCLGTYKLQRAIFLSDKIESMLADYPRIALRGIEELPQRIIFHYTKVDSASRTSKMLLDTGVIGFSFGCPSGIKPEAIQYLNGEVIALAKRIPNQTNQLRNIVRKIGAAALFAAPDPAKTAQLVASQVEQGAVAAASAQAEKKCMSLVFVEALALLPAVCLLIAPIGLSVWHYSQSENTVQSKIRLGLGIAMNFVSPLKAISMSLWGEKFISGMNV